MFVNGRSGRTMSKIDSKINFGLLTDLLTNPCGIPWGWTADIAEAVGGGPADGGGTDVGAPTLCGASCGVVLWACCNPPE